MLFHDITNLSFRLNPRTTAFQNRKGVIKIILENSPKNN